MYLHNGRFRTSIYRLAAILVLLNTIAPQPQGLYKDALSGRVQAVSGRAPVGQLQALSAAATALEITANGIEPGLLEVTVGHPVALTNRDSRVRRLRLGEGEPPVAEGKLYLPIVTRHDGGMQLAAPSAAPAGQSAEPGEIITLAPGESVTRQFAQPGNVPVSDAENPAVNALLLVTPAPQAEAGTAVGRVVDYSSKEAIAGATVKALETGYETTTDSEGYYTLPLPLGDYTLVIFASGYTFANRQVSIFLYAPTGVETVQLVPLDPVVTPIGPAGGTATSADGNTSVVFAAGAVSTTRAVRLTVLPVDETTGDFAALPGPFTDGSLPLGFAMFEPDGIVFADSAEWTIAYDGELPVGTAVPCYYWLEEEARWGEPVAGRVVDLGNGQKGLRATVPHFSAYGFALPPPPEPQPPDLPPPPDTADPNRANDHPAEEDQNAECGSQINLMSGELCQTVSTLPLPSKGGLTTQIAAKYSSGRIGYTSVVSTWISYRPNSLLPEEVRWHVTIGGTFHQDGVGQQVYAAWDGRDRHGNLQAPGLHMGHLEAASWYSDTICSECFWPFESSQLWPFILVRSDLSPFGIGWSGQHDTLLVNRGPWVSIIHGDGSQVNYKRQPDGTYTSPTGDFSTLVQNADNGWTRTYPDGMRLIFNADGRLTRMEDRFGNEQSLLYESNGQTVAPGEWGLTTRIRRVADGSGHIFDYGYDANGWLASITDSLGRIYRYEHNDKGHLTAAVDPLGQREEFTYDADGRMTSHTDKRGFKTTYTLDSQGRVIARTWPTGTNLTVQYGERQVVLTLDTGAPVVTTLDDRFNPVSRFNGVYTITTTYNEDLLPETSSQPPLTTLYDASGQAIELLGATTAQLERNAPFAQVSRATVSDGNDTQFTYDAQGNLVEIRDVLGQQTSLTYDAHGQPVSITDPLGHTSTLSYDERGQVIQRKDPLGRVWQQQYDGAGNLTAATDPASRVATMTYDGLNRLTVAQDALGGVTSFAYDANDNLTRITDPTQRAIAYTADSLNRLTSITNADGGQEQFTYDSLGHLTQVIDARNRSRSYAYDAAGRMVQKQVQGGPGASYRYADYDQLTHVDAGTQQTDLAYLANTPGYLLTERQVTAGLPLTVSVDYAYSGGLIDAGYAAAFALRGRQQPADLNTPRGSGSVASPPPLAAPEPPNADLAPAQPAALAPTALTCNATLSGSITTNLSLDPNVGPVHCFQSLTIDAGATVIVPAGVQFAGAGGDLVIRGALLLQGAAGAPAILTSQRDGPPCNGCGQNYRVIVEQAGRLELHHAQLRYAGYSVHPSVCQLTVRENGQVTAQASTLGSGGWGQMACVHDNGAFAAAASTLGDPAGDEPLLVSSSGVLSVTGSTLLGIDGIGQYGLRVNLANVAGLVNGGNVFSNTTGAPRWISVVGPEQIDATTTWLGQDASAGLTGGLFFEAALVVGSNSTLTVHGPWLMRGAARWYVGSPQQAGAGGHLRLLGTAGKPIRLFYDGSYCGFEGLEVLENGRLETAYVDLDGAVHCGQGGGAIVNVRKGGHAELQHTDIHNSGGDGVRLTDDGASSATIRDSRIYDNGGSGIASHPKAGPIVVSNTEVYNHHNPDSDAVSIPLSSAETVGPGVILHDNAHQGIRVAGAVTSDVTLGPLADGYYYNRTYDNFIVGGGSTLTLLPGADLRLASELLVDNGYLIGHGTPASPIRVSAYAGTRGPIILRNGGTASLSQALLAGSGGHGLQQEGNGGALLLDHTLVTANAGWGVHVDNPAAGVSIHHSSFVGNGSGGVRNGQPNVSPVDATRNCWGAASGPALAGVGPGQAVTDGVDVRPWSAAFLLPGDGRLSQRRLASNGSRPQEEAYGYDAVGRLTGLSSSGYSTFTVAYTYDAASRLLARTPLASLPVSVNYAYDAANRLTQLHVTGPGGPLLAESYSYDAVGNVTGVASSRTGNTAYTYDALDRLTGVSSPGFNAAYTYDAAGNRLSAGGVSYSYDAGGRLVSRSDGVAYAYDAAGNLSGKTQGGQTTSYTWDGENRLARIDYPDGGHSAYAYDDFGRRISKRTPDGATTYYVYLGLNLAQELDGAGAVMASYTYDGLDRPVTMWREGQTYTYLLDRLGSVVGLADASGAVVTTYRYDPWGNLIDSTGTVANPLRFTAREWDEESGLYFYRARYYDPQAGRFISRDPVGAADSRNLYAYVGNNPTGWRDPSGLTRTRRTRWQRYGAWVRETWDELVSWFDTAEEVQENVDRVEEIAESFEDTSAPENGFDAMESVGEALEFLPDWGPGAICDFIGQMITGAVGAVRNAPGGEAAAMRQRECGSINENACAADITEDYNPGR